jgi:hypothetical protein
MNTLSTKVASAAIGLSLFAPVFAFAQVGAAVNTNAAANITTTNAQVGVRAKVMASSTAETTRAARAKEKAAQEIDRRIASLNTLVARITAMSKVADTLKTNIKTNVQAQIDGLTALKTKIEADTDLATLKTDVKSVTDSYRIYMLVMPQTRITAAADRMATVINMMFGVGTKLQARINSAKASGADTAALEATLVDLGAKLSSAQTHATAAVNLIVALTPDNGDKTVMASNEAAIKNAQKEIKAGHEDLVAGRKDITSIIKGLATLKVSATASSSIQTQ